MIERVMHAYIDIYSTFQYIKVTQLEKKKL